MSHRSAQKGFLERWKTLDMCLQLQDLPLGSFERLRTKVAQPHNRSRSKNALQFAFVVLSVFVLLIGTHYYTSLPNSLGLVVVQASNDFRWNQKPGYVMEVERGEAEVFDQLAETRLEITQGTRIKRDSGSLRLLSGKAFVFVQKKPRPAPVRIMVSHGAIEVLGTKFTIEQGTQGGQVSLQTGRIRFVSDDGRWVNVQPGESLSWPLQKTAVNRQTEESRMLRKPVRTRGCLKRRFTQRQQKEFIKEIEKLRIQHRFRRLAQRLQQALHRIPDGRIRESLSYELGDILGYRLNHKAGACRHFVRHQDAYASGTYRTAIRKAIQDMGCSTQ